VLLGFHLRTSKDISSVFFWHLPHLLYIFDFMSMGKASLWHINFVSVISFCIKIMIDPWFSTFLVLWPFNTDPHVVMTHNHKMYFFFLSLLTSVFLIYISIISLPVFQANIHLTPPPPLLYRLPLPILPPLPLCPQQSCSLGVQSWQDQGLPLHWWSY